MVVIRRVLAGVHFDDGWQELTYLSSPHSAMQLNM